MKENLSIEIQELDSQNELRRGWATVTIDSIFKISGIFVAEREDVKGAKYISVTWPSVQNKKDGQFYQVCYPVDEEARKEIKREIADEFNKSRDLDITVGQMKVLKDMNSLKGSCMLDINGWRITNVKIIENKDKELFVSFPSAAHEVDEQKTYTTLCSSLSFDARTKISEAVLKAYEVEKNKETDKTQAQEADIVPDEEIQGKSR